MQISAALKGAKTPINRPPPPVITISGDQQKIRRTLATNPTMPMIPHLKKVARSLRSLTAKILNVSFTKTQYHRQQGRLLKLERNAHSFRQQKVLSQLFRLQKRLQRQGVPRRPTEEVRKSRYLNPLWFLELDLQRSNFCI